MYSMTGCGQGRIDGEPGSVTVEVTSVNGKHCQVQVRGDVRDPAAEDLVRRRVREVLLRGNVQVHIGFIPSAAAGMDSGRVAAVWRQLKALADELGAPTPGLDVALHVVPTSSAPPPAEMVGAALEAALDNCRAMRAAEGQALQRVCKEAQERLLGLRQSMHTFAEGRVPRQAERLRARLDEMLHEGVDEQRLAHEVALLAERLSVQEEIDRLASHLDQVQDACDQDGPIGRRLEFLCQEIGREVNTIGSKANDAALTALVVDAKTVLEDMKEQVANVL
jgi:uncharacterized protein YicC (UPF0701 family)